MSDESAEGVDLSNDFSEVLAGQAPTILRTVDEVVKLLSPSKDRVEACRAAILEAVQIGILEEAFDKTVKDKHTKQAKRAATQLRRALERVRTAAAGVPVRTRMVTLVGPRWELFDSLRTEFLRLVAEIEQSASPDPKPSAANKRRAAEAARSLAKRFASRSTIAFENEIAGVLNGTPSESLLYHVRNVRLDERKRHKNTSG